ncbi:zinc finger protein 569-like [Nilaparvata lugens]|uniref:zinc finger protein 569-like n=1 Tax=Nilaparvata lugens TaxID=108931 RepID=UPI00193D5073|nr:zinc finger protein 569-like [Nilaparvata lugens]XP_039295904.1 zinc finger protein 569-like [Nilaparvata lugens]
MSDETEIICRLCGLSCKQCFNIFDKLTCVNKLQYKIEQLLDIAVGESDNLPHSVCVPCVTKLDSMWCFKNNCHQVQIKLRRIRGFDESNNANCKSLQSKIDGEFLNPDNLRYENILSTSLPLQTSASNRLTFCDLLIKFENVDDYSDDVGKLNQISTHPSALVSVDVDEDCNDQKSVKPEPQSFSHLDYDNGWNMEDNSMSMIYEEHEYPNVECSVHKDVNIESMSCDDSSCSDTNSLDSSKISSSEDTDNDPTYDPTYDDDKNVQPFKTHNYRIETNGKSDLLCNRIPYLLVESHIGSKNMVFIISPDPSKFNAENDDVIDTDKLYLTPKTINLNDSNFIPTLIKWLNNLLEGKISSMPYYLGWKDSKNQFTIGFKCILCKQILPRKKQSVMNHLADHLLWICPVCGKFYRCENLFKNHLSKHSSPSFECATCSESLGSDFEKYKLHKRGHYKFSCPTCKFHCSSEKMWSKHLMKDRKNVELSSLDCSLFYESFDELRHHVSELATLEGYVCGACGMAYHCEEYLKTHMKVHGLEHGNNNSCDKSFENNDSKFLVKLDYLKNSSKEEHYDKLKKILVNETDVKEFQTSSMALGGKVSTAFICFKCYSCVKTEKQFRLHIESHLLMTCSKCKKCYNQIKTFTGHFRKCSFETRKCVLCKNDIWLNTREKFIEHLSLHKKKKICIYCQVIEENPYKLERHIKSSHRGPKSWFCDICNESVIASCKTLRSSKFKHMQVEHPAVKEDYTCTYCSRKYRSKEYLIHHIQKHMAEKSFKCEICKKSFIQLGLLKKHLKDMHPDSNRKCQVCGKQFKYFATYSTHMSKAHTTNKGASRKTGKIGKTSNRKL